jgi:hypothetical protein
MSSRAQSLKKLFATIKEKVQEPTPHDAPSSKHSFYSVNVYGNIADESDDDEYVDDGRSGSEDLSSLSRVRQQLPWYKLLGKFFVKQQEWVFLLVLGLCSSVLALTVEETIRLVISGSHFTVLNALRNFLLVRKYNNCHKYTHTYHWEHILPKLKIQWRFTFRVCARNPKWSN